MQTQPETKLTPPDFQQIATILRYVGWGSFWAQLGLAITAGLCLLFALSGRNLAEETTPGIGIGIFWALCGVIVLLINVYFAFRWTRFARRFRNQNPAVHPTKAEVLKILRWGVMVGFAGMLAAILGEGASLGVLLAKSIAQPQGVAIYDPVKVIRSLDLFVAMANFNGITANFIGAAASLSLFSWLHHQ